MKSRLGKLERVHGDARADRAHDRALMQKVAGLVLHAFPDMMLVRPEDTDEQTYAEIEETRLTAAGRHEEADALHNWLAQFTPKPPAPLVGKGCAVAAWWSRGSDGWGEERSRAKKKALAAARARVERREGWATAAPSRRAR